METFNSYANPGYGAMLRANDAMGSDVVLNTKYGLEHTMNLPLFMERGHKYPKLAFSIPCY